MESVRITARDQSFLKFAAEHRIVLAAHAQAVLGVSAPVARTRLRGLAENGLLRRHSILEVPGRCYSITRRGLSSIDSALPVPRFDANGYRHDVGLAWVWLAARGGAFGALREIVSERRMRSSDATEAHASRITGGAVDPFAVRLGGTGPGGRERLHYPDLILIDSRGSRVAVELELTPKARTRRERILAGYAADRSVAGVLYLVERRAVGRGIERSAERVGLQGRVRVQPVRWGSQAPAGPSGATRERLPRRASARGGRIEAGR